MAIQLIAGLQNPGSAYEKTRHNAGAWFVQALAREFSSPPWKASAKLKGHLTFIEIDGVSCRLLLPDTFMNLSGQSVRLVCAQYGIPPEALLVVHDEIDLDAGRVKLKSAGGHGGHNGLRDIIQQLGSNAFHRLRFGIGHPGLAHMVHDYVLGKPTPDERSQILTAFEKAMPLMPTIVSGKFGLAMTQLNG
jgi:PTH1 family peptidyl-tRNA hydrolase